ncbi:MAG: hypothetical protein A3J74_08795 [Elusimicrobia bacterium RIFCSPHIGHO2_02_FULL_57_9]|nr:MAG: hypothetical protein A3J74_08795 [Elusimicrobia bacterium RIFCSPHIGHO2_02_FULL_57_9]
MVIVENIERVRVLRLANPPSNVLNINLLQSLKAQIQEAGNDGSVRCLVLASSYPRYFSTGLDLTEVFSLPDGRRSEPFAVLLDVYRGLRDLPKPTLAALSGSAVLGGWILAMACDFRLLSQETGKIALSEIRFGLSPTAELIRRLLSFSSSPSLVKDMILRGKALRAQEALAGGFVDSLAPAASLEEQALHEAKGLSKLAPGAYAAVKGAWLRCCGDRSFEAGSREDFERIFAAPEAKEGMAAMVGKRRPRWEQ